MSGRYAASHLSAASAKVRRPAPGLVILPRLRRPTGAGPGQPPSGAANGSGHIWALSRQRVQARVHPQLPCVASPPLRASRHGDARYARRGTVTGTVMGSRSPPSGPGTASDLRFAGADDGIRTRDPNLGKVELAVPRVGCRPLTCASVRGVVRRMAPNPPCSRARSTTACAQNPISGGSMSLVRSKPVVSRSRATSSSRQTAESFLSAASSASSTAKSSRGSRSICSNR